MIQAPPRRELLISTQVVAGGRGRALEEGAVAGLALDGGVDSLVGLHVVVAPGSTPLSEDHSLVTASLPMPRGDRVLVTGVDGRRVRKSALGLDEDGRDTILAEVDGRTCPVEVEHGSLAVCCCPQTIVPGETRLRLRAVWTSAIGTTSRRWRGAPEI